MPTGRKEERDTNTSPKLSTHFMMVLKSSEVIPLSGSDSRLMMSGSRL